MSHNYRPTEEPSIPGSLGAGPVRWTLLWVLLLAGPGALPAQEAVPVETPVVAFLVRHAEKVDDGDDPALSPAGAERAELLTRVLGDAGVTHIHSTDFKRTRDTAAPLARFLGLEVEIYDHGHLDLLAERIRNTPGRHLVVGHSNTTPEVAGLLGGDPGSPIDEAGEYDRLYTVVVDGDGTTTVLTRFGPG